MYEKLRSEVPLLTPGITILSVGTEIRYGETMAPDLRWEEELNQGWNRAVVVEEGTKLNLKFQVRHTLENMVRHIRLSSFFVFSFLCKLLSLLITED